MDTDEKSGNGGVKKRKLSPNMEINGKKRSNEIGQSGIPKLNSNGDVNEAKIYIGKEKKRKLSTMEETSSKRSDDKEHVDEGNGGLPIFKLPGELLIKIIYLVPISQWASLESVSRRFQDVVHDLWGQLREIRLDELIYNEEKKKADPCQIGEAVLEKFLIRAPNVASISGFDEFSDEFSRRTSIRLSTIRVLSKFEHLESIDFSGYIVAASDFAVFLESSASRQCWKSLDICDGVFGKMESNNAFGNKIQPALNLESLKFNMQMLNIFDRFLPIEWSGLKKLVVVNSIRSAIEVLSIIRQCTQLVHLEIRVPKCGNGSGQPSYGDFMQGVADLETLSVLKITSIWDTEEGNALLVLIQDLGRRGIITSFDLAVSYCTDQILDAISDQLPHLKSLDLSLNLKSLQLRITKPSLLRLANRLGQLESLKLISCWNVIDDNVVRAIGNMSGLQRLHLEFMSNVGSVVFASLSDLRKLKELRITRDTVNWLTTGAWIRLGFGSCLETLELYLDDGNSPSFLKNMPRLRSVKLWNATNSIVHALAEYCPRLAELNVIGSPTISCTGIQSVVDRCSQLKILKVSDHYGWFPASLAVGKYRKITFKSRED